MPLVAIQSLDFIEIGLLPYWYPFYFIAIIGLFQAFHQRFYAVGQAYNQIVTAAFCGNFFWTIWTVWTVFLEMLLKGWLKWYYR
jgi:hypothetical protein